MQRAVQQHGSGGLDRFLYWPLQDSLHSLGAAISGYPGGVSPSGRRLISPAPNLVSLKDTTEQTTAAPF
jgi:hypothetical protein